MKRLLLFAALIAWSGMAGAVVYKWVDARGELQYGDRPPDGVHAEVVEFLGGHQARDPTARASDSGPAAPAASAARAPAANKPPDDPAQKAVDADVAQAREKQCAEAQDRYKKMIEGRRLFKTGANGEREYLTSEEIDSERLNAKRDVDSICNSPT
ncbi:MAG: DUF4124 domain-containing protein [Gammaproteobacteria bacterium]